MDLHDHRMVADYYESYVNQLTDNTGFDTEDCINFHMDLAQNHSEHGILEIGCGTGIITLPLLENGFFVVSIDLSKEMIRILDQKIKKLPHLLTPEDQREALANIHKHLRKGGILTLDTFAPNISSIILVLQLIEQP